jgi:hypothetical protein
MEEILCSSNALTEVDPGEQLAELLGELRRALLPFIKESLKT